MTMLDSLSEFTWIDPSEMHLVKRPANSFDSPLLEKAAEALEEEYDAFIQKFVDGLCEVSGCEVCHERLRVVKADEQHLEKAKLKAKERKALPKSDFALPERAPTSGSYPINDESHARAALSRLHNASPEDQKRIKAAVHRRYPNIEIDDEDDTAKEAGMECSHCHGSGTVDGVKCGKCLGKGTEPQVGDTVKNENPDKSIPKEEALSQTREVVVGDVGSGVDPDPEDGGTPKHPADMSPGHADGDGEGDTAPEKGDPKGEALSQTNDDIGGSMGKEGDEPAAADPVVKADEPDPNVALKEAANRLDELTSALETATAKGASFVNMHGASAEGTGGGPSGGEEADHSPGSSAWEAKDAMLADIASHLILRANEMIELLGNRERAEKALSAEEEKALRKEMQGLIEKLESATTVQKGTEDMTNEELIKFLDERDDARRKLEKAEAKKAEKKALLKAKKAEKKKAKMKGGEKPDGEGEEDMAAKVAKAAEAASEVTPKVKKTELFKMYQEQGELLGKIAAQDGHRVMISEAGVRAGVSAPVFRGIDGASDPNSAFKELDDAIAAQDALVKANPENIEAHVERDRLFRERTVAKMIANERARKANPSLETSPFPDSAQIITNRRALPEDSSLSGMNGSKLVGAARR